MIIPHSEPLEGLGPIPPDVFLSACYELRVEILSSLKFSLLFF